jgi:hypothetical protein
MDCYEPLFYEIAHFLADSPRDLTRFVTLTGNFQSTQGEAVLDEIWNGMYARKWNIFHECLTYQGLSDWRSLYEKTETGHVECMVEVLEREKKVGFAMAAMAAQIQYEHGTGGYVARYISASAVVPERIPLNEEYRLRFCPPSVRHQLLAGPKPFDSDAIVFGASTHLQHHDGDMKGSSPPVSPSGPRYPFKVLEGTDDLVVGQPVELQWKMQFGSPFGWWYGHLEALEKMPTDNLAIATITFLHFPATSRWHRLRVQFGDAEMRPCSFGGFTGGLRAVSKSENAKRPRVDRGLSVYALIEY